MYNPKVSVIIPIYKVENFIEKCAYSLFNQTLTENIEFIFINDNTPDDSIKLLETILSKYPKRKSQCKFITHFQNEGVGKSRLDGLNLATGEYIIHCDPDDWVEPEIYEKLYKKAKETDADIVICDYKIYSKGKFSLVHQNINIEKDKFLQALIRNEIHNGLWNKLIRKKTIDKVKCPFEKGINLCEDRNFISRAAYYAKKISYINEPLYIYNKYNTNSYTNNWNSNNTNSILRVIKNNKLFFRNTKHNSDPFEIFGIFMILFGLSPEDRTNFCYQLPKNIDYSIFKPIPRIYAYLLFNQHYKVFTLFRKILKSL